MTNLLVDDLNRLIKPKRKQFTLEDRPEAGRILGGRFLAEKKEVTAVAVSSNNPRIEVLTVWSEILVVQEAALEVPTDWPTLQTYTGTPVFPVPLPEGVVLVGANYLVDTLAPYYLQKRVHLIGYERQELDGSIQYVEDQLLSIMLPPYEGGYYQGVNPFTAGWEVKLYGSVVSANELTQTRVQELITAGVIF